MLDMTNTNRPWGINSIGNMVGSPDIQSSRNGGAYYRSVPTPYRKNWCESIRAAWWVLSGKAEAVVWPDAGDLERSLSERTPRGAAAP